MKKLMMGVGAGIALCLLANAAGAAELVGSYAYKLVLRDNSGFVLSGCETDGVDERVTSNFTFKLYNSAGKQLNVTVNDVKVGVDGSDYNCILTVPVGVEGADCARVGEQLTLEVLNKVVVEERFDGMRFRSSKVLPPVGGSFGVAPVSVGVFQTDGDDVDYGYDYWLWSVELHAGTKIGGPADDFDGDGLPNLREYQFGTDPLGGDLGLRDTSEFTITEDGDGCVVEFNFDFGHVYSVRAVGPDGLGENLELYDADNRGVSCGKFVYERDVSGTRRYFVRKPTDGLAIDLAVDGRLLSSALVGPTVTLPVVSAGYSSVVSNETTGAIVWGRRTDDRIVYTVATGDVAKVYFKLKPGYVFVSGDGDPMGLGAITEDRTVAADAMPKVLALMGVAAYPAAKTYDGKATNIAFVVTNYLGEAITDATVYLREPDGMWVAANRFADYLNVTNATVEVKAEKTGHTTATNAATVAISPRAVTLTSATDSWTYDGQAHSNVTVDVALTGGALGERALPEGEGIVFGGFPTITEVGTVPNAFAYAFLEGTKAANYSVSCVTGALMVVAVTIDPTTDPDGEWPSADVDPEDPEAAADPGIAFSSFDTTNVYDGAAHTVDTNRLEAAYRDLFLGNAPSFSYALQSNGTYAAEAPAFTDATVTSVWYKVSAANFNDVIHPAKVIVTRRAVTLTSADGNWVYDGQAHSNVTVTATLTGGALGERALPEGEGIAFDGFATITDVGTVPNAFMYAFLEGTKAENYSVSCVTGLLTVTVMPIGESVTMAAVADVTYAGFGHEPRPAVSNVVLGAELVAGTDFDYSWESNTNVGTAKVIAVLKGNYTGALTNEFAIGRKEATIASGSTSWAYDAQEHAFTNLAVTGFVAGEGLATTGGWATITEVGTVPNAFAFTLRGNTLASNYALAVTTGEISVVAATIDPATDPDRDRPAADVDPENPEAAADPEIAFSSFDTTNVYDGVAHTIDTNALEAAYRDLFRGSVPSFSYALQSNGTYVAEAPAFTDATVTSVWYKVSAANFNDVIHPAKVIVTRRAVTLTSANGNWIYDGFAHSNATVDVTLTGGALGERALPEGEGIVFGGFPAITDAGTAPNAFAYAFLEGTKAENYSVSCVTGLLTVTAMPVGESVTMAAAGDVTYAGFGHEPRPAVSNVVLGVELVAGTDFDYGWVSNTNAGTAKVIAVLKGNYAGALTNEFAINRATLDPLSGFDTTNVYDGVAHTIDTNALERAYADKFLGNAPSFGYALQSNGTYGAEAPAFTDVTVTSVWYKVSAANFNDVIHPAKVIVTNRCVTLMSATDSWPYDGQAHSNTTVTVGGAGFVAGEGVTTNGFPTITEVGALPNAFSYAFLEGTKAENYNVSCVTGTLTVGGYWVGYDGAGAGGTMETDFFFLGVPTNLTANAYTAVGYAFRGWTTNGVDKLYDDRAEGVDFAEPGATLPLRALWSDTGVTVRTFAELTNALVTATNQTAMLPVRVILPADIVFPADGCVTVYAGDNLPAIAFEGEGRFDVSGIVPQWGEPVVVGEGFAEADLARFDTKDVSWPVYETEGGRVILHARGEYEVFPWILDEENGVTAWVDPALTNIAAVVIDNGLQAETNAIDLVTLTNNLAVYGYEPALPVGELNALVKIANAEGVGYVMPVEWDDADGNGYDTLADALAAGVTEVVPDFVITEETPQVIAEKAETDDGETYTAVVRNETNGVDDPVKAIYAAGLLGLAEDEKKNVTLVATAKGAAEVGAAVVRSLAEANTNGVADIVGYVADYVDLSLYFGEVQQPQIGESLAIQVPWTINPRQVYRVSRVHKGVAEPLPAGAENAVDGEYVEVLADGFVIHAKKYSLYAIGEITQQPCFGIVVGDGWKTLGEPDPSYIATNFTVSVRGLGINPEDIRGYCKRAKGEAEGEYAINFVCTKIPQGYGGRLVEYPGVFTIRGPEMLEGSGTVKYPSTYKVKGYDTGLLKEKANASWAATPAMGCVFAGWVAADGAPEAVTNHLAASSANELKNKKLTFKVGEGEQVAPTDVEATWARIDEDEIESVAIDTNGLHVVTKSYVTATVSGLPSGLKFDAKKLAITGTARKDETKTVKVSVKNASGYTWKQSFAVTVSGGAITQVVPADDLVTTGVPVMLWCDPMMGTVKGTGVVALSFDKKTGVWSKKVSISATAKSGYVFAGWYLDPGFAKPAEFFTGSGKSLKPKDYREASQSVTVTEPTYLFARFVAKTTKADPITWLRYAGAGYCGAAKDWLAEEETWYQGVALPTNGCQVAFGSASLPTVTVSGLPAGVKFDKATCRFTGVPTAASTDRKPYFTVKVTVKNKSGATDVLTKYVYVEPLPAWAVGNFDGYHMEGGTTNGTFTATVGKTGKVSGKTKGGWADTSFSAKNFSEVFTWDGTNFIYAVDVTVSYRDPVTRKTEKQVDTLYLMENLATHLGTIGGGDAEGNGCMGVQRAWDRKDLDFPAFDTKALKTPLTLDNGLTLKFGAKGKVTVGGTVDGIRASGTTYVLPTVWQSTMTPNLLAQVCVYVAPKKGFDGLCAVYDVLLSVGADGKFDTVSPATEVPSDIHAPVTVQSGRTPSLP